MTQSILAQTRAAAEAAGLGLRGGFVLSDEERVGPLALARSVLLLGFVGAQGWPAFAASPEAADGERHPLDRWSRRVVTALSERLRAMALFPFDGPPYWPFQAWAQRAETLSPSPLGLLIHPEFGLWHNYRGALIFAEEIDLPAKGEASSPCASCADKPCLTACPVSAFSPAGYNVTACVEFLRQDAECLDGGCLARRACPVGREFRFAPPQARFHMAAFLKARR